jgi:hypothetical protein
LWRFEADRSHTASIGIAPAEIIAANAKSSAT